MHVYFKKKKTFIKLQKCQHATYVEQILIFVLFFK